jgi:hypothetical protein
LNGRIKSLFLAGPVGRLEALLNEGAADAAYCALVCHPHPQFGGTMHNKVVFHAAKALNGFGFPVLRFNFRGTGHSQGEHDQGRGEVDEVRAALAWLQQEFRRPVVFAGFSFGASTGMPAACPDPNVRALISLGTPVRVEARSYDYGFLAQCAKPKLFLSGEHDEFGPRAQVEKLVATAAEPKKLLFIPGDHFFAGHLGEMRAAIEDWVRATLL